ncbi:hypothetical protein BES34_021145 [Leptospira inadai serovar Lyme]|uniref:Uncharacterized protein n=1 Tax=Leptospira inadai serovar Lyme TaxID=293084 RepID=A0ABX4YCP1_9LEPT|nr:hypothetical protein BES34_021145 [Leptospira inadai serovar Lyme]
MEILFTNVLSPRGLRTEDRGQKLLDFGKVTEVRDKSPVTTTIFLENMEILFTNVLSPRGLMTEDRGLKLLEVGKVTEVRDKSSANARIFL